MKVCDCVNYLCVKCVCVCVREREGERERLIWKENGLKTMRECTRLWLHISYNKLRVCVCVYLCVYVYVEVFVQFKMKKIETIFPFQRNQEFVTCLLRKEPHWKSTLNRIRKSWGFHTSKIFVASVTSVISELKTIKKNDFPKLINNSAKERETESF
jgi:hypothetical protein